jgi:hypothetical protein
MFSYISACARPHQHFVIFGVGVLVGAGVYRYDVVVEGRGREVDGLAGVER